MPLRLILTPGNRNDITQAPVLIEGYCYEVVGDKRLILDKPYFDSNQWQRGFLSQVLDWNDDFDTQYLDVVTAPYFSQEDLKNFSQPKSAREILKDRQDQMQTDIARRVQGFLAEDTGNREEKLSIICKTLSENWSPDIADGVLEQLRD